MTLKIIDNDGCGDRGTDERSAFRADLAGWRGGRGGDLVDGSLRGCGRRDVRPIALFRETMRVAEFARDERCQKIDWRWMLLPALMMRRVKRSMLSR